MKYRAIFEVEAIQYIGTNKDEVSKFSNRKMYEGVGSIYYFVGNEKVDIDISDWVLIFEGEYFIYSDEHFQQMYRR